MLTTDRRDRLDAGDHRDGRRQQLHRDHSLRLRLSSFLCKRLLILWLGRGSSALDGVPVLAAVKPGRQVRSGGRVDRGCAPARLAGMEEPRRVRPPGWS